MEHNRLAVNIRFLLAAMAMPSTNAGDMVYFLVGPTSFAPSDLPHDSCILPIPKKQVADIRHARDLIENLRAPDSPITRRLVVASIEVGADGINHDLLNPELPAWNWHVKEFAGFWDFTVGEVADSPSAVEKRPAYWAQKGIAFPSHTVVRDLGEEPVFVRAKLVVDRMRLNWWSPGTNLVFTVESTASLMPPDWQPIPGTQWPITDRTWTSNSAVTDPYFRVIRATSPGN
jgi:hypothetical protein